MDCRTLDITVLSARNLKRVKFQKSGAYVTVFISGDYRSVQQTPLDLNPKRNPKWNHPMKFTVNEAAVQSEDLSLIFRLRYDNTNRAKSHEVGEVRVLIKDILNPKISDKTKTVTYSVRLSSGKIKGELDFSYRFSDTFVGKDADVAQPLSYPGHGLGLFPINGGSSVCPPQGHANATSTPSSRPQHRKYKSCTCSEGKIGSGLGLGAGFGLIGSLMFGETMDNEGGSKTSSKVTPVQEH